MLSKGLNKNWTAWILLIITAMIGITACGSAEQPIADAYLVRKTADFEINGSGSSPQWDATPWTRLTVFPDYPSEHQTEFKMLYSDKGIYVLFNCGDSALTNTLKEDRAPLYNEDVVEVFLQPDSSRSHYFEYELSPLNYETPLLIFNNQGDLNSWHPFEIREERKLKHATDTSAMAMRNEPGKSGWKAEFFIPFDLLRPLNGHQPKSGEQWKANFYRIDYDKGEALWAWKLNSGNFHEYQHFGTIIFE